jgi:hypothetical protein
MSQTLSSRAQRQALATCLRKGRSFWWRAQAGKGADDFPDLGHGEQGLLES